MSKSDEHFEKIRESIKSGQVKFEIASQDRVSKLEFEVELVLTSLGHPEALVTDESKISDFLDQNGEISSDDSSVSNLEELAELLGVPVTKNDYIWQVADRLVPIN